MQYTLKKNGMVEHINVPETCYERVIGCRGPASSVMRANKLMHIGYSDLCPPYEVERINACQHVVLCTLDGSATFIGDGCEYELTPGTILIGPAKIYQHYWSHEYWKMLWLHILIDDVWGLNDLKSQILLKTEGLDIIATYIERFRKERLQNNRDSLEAAAAYLQLIVIEFRRRIAQNSMTAPVDDYYNRLLTVWEEVDNSLDKDWHVETLAELFGISSAQFCRIVKKYENKSPMNKILELRMKRAEELILSTSHKLDYIATKVGFSTSFSFSKAFKRYYKVSPTDYRKINN